ncbi:MAG: ribosome silencing factor [Ruminococcus sp.]|nr:ribosome silencing factor [Ruminococcus sp.]
MTQQEKFETIVKTLDLKKGEDIQALKVADLTILADYFIIVNGTSNTHARTLADEVEFQLSQKGTEPQRRESDTGNTWIILDYADIIVHVFDKTQRQFYNLEGLWADANPVDISDLLIKE